MPKLTKSRITPVRLTSIKSKLTNADDPDACHVHRTHLTSNRSHALISVDKKAYGLHRILWMVENGSFPKSYLYRQCGTVHCYNPKHFAFEQTQQHTLARTASHLATLEQRNSTRSNWFARLLRLR